MNVLIFIKKHSVFLSLFVIVVIALLVRVVLLDRVPTGLSDDEISYIQSSQSFFYTGKDLRERWSPLSLTKPPHDVIISFGRVPFILFSPFFGNVNLSMFTARLPYAVLGGLFVFVIFIICSKLFSPNIGLIVSLIYALNPWSIFFSRTAYESPIALYFAFSMFALLLYVKSWKILLAFPLYILSFYSYLGTNIILPFVSIITVMYCWLLNKKKYTGYYILLIVLVFILYAGYIIHLPNDLGGQRTDQILMPNSPMVVKSINLSRQNSIQSPLMNIFINKYEQSAKIFVNQYLGAFSPVYLFSTGEGVARFTLWSHGTFYLVDILFLAFGFIVMLRRRKPEAILLLSILLIAPLPSALSAGDLQYALRSSFIYPVLIIFIGYGIYAVINVYKRKTIPIILIGLLYAIFVANFGYQYIFINPINNYDSFGISGRIFAKYMQLAGQHGYKSQVLSNGPNKSLFRQYIYFNNEYRKDNHSEIASLLSKDSIQIDNLIFTDCQNINMNPSEITLIPFNQKCTDQKLSNNILTIANYANNQGIYLIYNDLVCKQYNILPYLNNLQLKDFDIEHLDEETFCQKFFTRDAGYTSTNSTGSAVPADGTNR